MIHYHGTPISPRATLLELAGRHFCVSFAAPGDVKVCHEIGQSVMLDNGAYSIWRDATRPPFDPDKWRAWAEPWLAHRTTWAVLPDVVDGGENENDALLERFADMDVRQVAPVWHLHESTARLLRLCGQYDRVCFGSSGSYAIVNSPGWHRRISEAFNAIVDDEGCVPWIHMLRGMSQSGGGYPFASVDSTDVARNHHLRRNARAMADRWDGLQTPARWRRTGTQLELEAA